MEILTPASRLLIGWRYGNDQDLYLLTNIFDQAVQVSLQLYQVP